MRIEKDVSLRPYNTLRVDAKANYYVEIHSEEDLMELFADGFFDRFKDYLVLGGGSNILFVADMNTLVIRMCMQEVVNEVVRSDVYVKAGGGVIWDKLVNYCVDRGFGGIENLSLIPGTVGAAPIQNIGAYGVELKDVFQTCRAFDVQLGKFVHLSHSDCAFGYRDSVFKHKYKNRYIITQVNLLLSTESKVNTVYGAINMELEARGISEPTIRDISQVVAAIRLSKLPDTNTIGNCGSFFKNPIVSVKAYEKLLSNFVDIISYSVGSDSVKIAAGWLIEKSGWKGIKKGQVGTWDKQALVLVNHGKATGIEVYNFSEEIISSVQEKFDIVLEREVNVLPHA